jgi:hypothetical protein
MTELPDSTLDQPQEAPGIAALLSQFGSDATSFARAEANYLKAQAGERASYAVPALAMIVMGISLIAGALIALLVGLIILLSPRIGVGSAVAAIVGGSFLLALLLLWAGSRRLRGAFKKPEER